MQPARIVWRAVVAAATIYRRDVDMAFHCQKEAQYYIAYYFCLSRSEDDPTHPWDILILLFVNRISYVNANKLLQHIPVLCLVRLIWVFKVRCGLKLNPEQCSCRFLPTQELSCKPVCCHHCFNKVLTLHWFFCKFCSFWFN